MERKLSYTCGRGDYDYVISDGVTTINLEGCVIFEAVFPLEEFDDIVENCQANGGIGIDEFEGFTIVETPADISKWNPLYETDEEYEAAVDW